MEKIPVTAETRMQHVAEMTALQTAQHFALSALQEKHAAATKAATTAYEEAYKAALVGIESPADLAKAQAAEREALREKQNAELVVIHGKKR